MYVSASIIQQCANPNLKRERSSEKVTRYSIALRTPGQALKMITTGIWKLLLRAAPAGCFFQRPLSKRNENRQAHHSVATMIENCTKCQRWPAEGCPSSGTFAQFWNAANTPWPELTTRDSVLEICRVEIDAATPRRARWEYTFLVARPF